MGSEMCIRDSYYSTNRKEQGAVLAAAGTRYLVALKGEDNNIIIAAAVLRSAECFTEERAGCRTICSSATPAIS